MSTSVVDLPVPPPLPKLAEAESVPVVGRLWPALTVVPALVVVADYLFWNPPIGVSVGLFSSLLAVTIFALHAPADRRLRPAIAAGLILVASVATLFEMSFTNVVVLLALLVVLVGESFYGAVGGTPWARWSEALLSWVCAPARWYWFFRRFMTSALVSAGLSRASADVVARSLQVVAPAACLGIVFLVVLQQGNAVFNELCRRCFQVVIDWIDQFDLSFWHLVFLGFIATAVLTLVQPRETSGRPRIWTRRWSRVNRKDRIVALWQSMSILVVLNVLFFTVNTIDVLYLWQHTTLPTGVGLSAFVHQGVFSLIFATVLSAIVLTALFQQSLETVRNRGVKALALAWIAQNVILIAGVVLRLKLYVDACDLSTQRVYVGCFLLLVTAGFGLLAWHIVRDGSLNDLIFRNVVAVFVLFFIIQFVNVAGIVARLNVDRWTSGRTQVLDSDYLMDMGPAAWGVLCDVATDPHHSTVHIRDQILERAEWEKERLSRADWRSFEVRRNAAAKKLIDTAARLNSGSIVFDHPG